MAEPAAEAQQDDSSERDPAAEQAVGDKPSRASQPEWVLALALLVIAPVCALVLLWVPRPVEPEMPSLTLSRALVAAALRKDAARVSKASTGDEALALEDLMMQQGIAEKEVVEAVGTYNARRDALGKAHRALVAAVGEEGALAVRARALQRFEAALDLSLPDEQVQGVMGGFASTLAQEGTTREGRIVAPRFVLRTLYKARWNLLCQTLPQTGFEPIERQAFYGWQALHGERLTIQRRVDALSEYAAAGGANAEEALGALLYRGREYGRAAQVLRAAYEQTGSLRLRNSALRAHIMAGSPRPNAPPPG